MKAVFTHVLESSAIAKCFKQKLYCLSGYKYVKPYLKQTGYSDELAGKLAQDINEAAWVYDYLQKIIINLVMFESINIRRLSMRQLFLANDAEWCYRYVEDHRMKESKPDEPIYEEQDIIALENSIRCTTAY